MSRGSKTDTSRYIPGYRYDAAGITQRQFETQYNKAIPVEDGMIRDPDAAAKSLIVVNLSSNYIDAAISRDEPLDPRLPNTRYNEKEIVTFPLPRGRSSHVPLDPECYIVTVGEYVNNSAGSRNYLSHKGFKLSDLQDTAVLAKGGRRSGTIEYITNSNTEQDGYFTFLNHAPRPLTVTVVRENTAYTPSDAELIEMRKSRKPDLGGNVVAQVMVLPKAKWTYRSPLVEYRVRALQPFDDQAVKHTGSSYCSTIAPINDYVDQASNDATIGDTAIIFDTNNRDGSVEVVVYQSSELKFVTGDIVITK